VLCAALMTGALLATTLASDARKEDTKEDKK
jgi:hypothetical protein